ncbi:hypothetical protein [Billgrantia kenyensis]|uniref:Biofilm PGA synthesis protein PgaD n=1 Tax=Billgrantia kenyensis TaxID=321266 RepID=A0A7W0AE07_9GAMM|nr:hypothetical protein [Halomonas kenyensis]MBA2779811.1 hypothetical protein [Halomonas kenyensis]MCG6662212.1 hypothetical protein [Halomonas kenyensis]
MRHSPFPQRPLFHGLLLLTHLLLQLSLMASAVLWLLPRSSWLATMQWNEAWPLLALGSGLWLAAVLSLHLLLSLCLRSRQRATHKGFAPSDVVTRSFERRPAVHDSDSAWTSEARAIEIEPSIVGSARVTRPAEPFRPQ